MDKHKTRGVRRAKATRFSPPNKQIIKQSGPDFKNCSREKLRRLSFVERHCSKTVDCEMGSVQSDGEDEFRPSKRFKLPNKFFYDCPRVDNAPVPRKLRSAMRKRCRESVSPQFREVKNLNHTANGMELVKRDGMKKSKLKQPEEYDGSPRLTSVVPISKDEEEVAETLYALAGMFSDSDKTEKPNSTVQEEDSQTTFTTTALEPARESSNKVGSAHETGIQFLDQGTDFYSQRCKQFHTDIPKSGCTKVSIFSESFPASGSLSNNSTLPNHSELRRGPQSELHLSIKENKNSGLSSTRVHGAKMPGSPVRFSATELPTWRGISSDNARSSSSQNVSLAEKESRSHFHAKNTWKKCSTHVHISRLISVLKDTEAKENLPLVPTQLAAHDGSNHGIHSENSSKITDAVLLHKGLLEYQQQASTNSGSYTTLKQRTFNFLSLSAGSCGVEEERCTGGHGNGHQPEPSTQSHVLYMRPFTQSQTSMPVSLPQNRHISTSFVDSAAAGAAQMAQIQQPPYLGNSTTSLTDYQKQQLQQQQWLWAAQLIAPYKPEEFAAAAAHIQHWKNSRQELRIMQYAQPLHPASLDVLGPRYIPVSQEQQRQQKRLISSKSPLRQGYNHHQLPTSHEGGVFRPDKTLSMKLLYSEHM